MYWIRFCQELTSHMSRVCLLPPLSDLDGMAHCRTWGLAFWVATSNTEAWGVNSLEQHLTNESWERPWPINSFLFSFFPELLQDTVSPNNTANVLFVPSSQWTHLLYFKTCHEAGSHLILPCINSHSPCLAFYFLPFSALDLHHPNKILVLHSCFWFCFLGDLGVEDIRMG